jgi:hypothetical protein
VSRGRDAHHVSFTSGEVSYRLSQLHRDQVLPSIHIQAQLKSSPTGIHQTWWTLFSSWSPATAFTQAGSPLHPCIAAEVYLRLSPQRSILDYTGVIVESVKSIHSEEANKRSDYVTSPGGIVLMPECTTRSQQNDSELQTHKAAIHSKIVNQTEYIDGATAHRHIPNCWIICLSK